MTVQARLAEPEIYLGESTTLELHIHGLRHPDQPDLTHPAIDVTKAGGQSLSPSSHAIINGQVRQTEAFGYVARYILRPRSAGTLAIPALHVLRSAPVPLRVDAASALDVSEVIDTAGVPPKSLLGQELTAGILANYSGEGC